MNNIKCFLLKLADRDDNLKTFTNLKDNKQVRMAFETQAIFSPLESII
jgi:(p)ppGpp synthase/HD superfamily hydrolase